MRSPRERWCSLYQRLICEVQNHFVKICNRTGNDVTYGLNASIRRSLHPWPEIIFA